MARPIAEHYGRAIRRAYSEAELTQVELAKELQERGWVKVDQTYVSRWARGLVKADNDVLIEIDSICVKPRGWILEEAGYVDAEALVAARRRQADADDDDGAGDAAFEASEATRAVAAEAQKQAAARKRPAPPRSA